jgi:MFS transporter, ACS family, tartrate transporter
MPVTLCCSTYSFQAEINMTLDVERSAMRKIWRRLIIYLALLYFAAFIDRTGVSFAASQMQRDIGLTAYEYGLGAGVFFLSYCMLEVPSNVLMDKFGARLWIARIMITWGLIAGAMVFTYNATSFYAFRFLLGAAEAGFFPGVIYYLTYWLPARERGRMIGLFMTAIPISTAIGGPMASAILQLDGAAGLAGWQWLFLLETIPSLTLGIVTWLWLRDRPSQVNWLSAEEKAWLQNTLDAEAAYRSSKHQIHGLQVLANPRVLALGLCYFGVQIGQYGAIFWVPQIFKNAGVPEAVVGYVVAIPYAIAALGMVWWGRHSDFAKERIGHIAIGSVVGCAGLVVSAYFLDSPLISIIAITVGVGGTLSIVPIFWTLPSAFLSGAAAAGGLAFINAFGALGAFTGPYAIGWIKQSTGSFAYGLIAVGAGVLFTGVMALLIGHDRATESSGDATLAKQQGNSGGALAVEY